MHRIVSLLPAATEIAAALGLKPNDLGIDLEALSATFKERNKIVHELDMRSSPGPDGKKRTIRNRAESIAHTKRLLAASARFLDLVDKKLS